MAFSNIKLYTTQDIYKKMIENQNWDMIFWVKREMVTSKNLPMDKSASFIDQAGLSACSDFHNKAGELLFNFVRIDDTHSISSITSAFAVNFHSLYDFISKRIEDIDS